VTDYKRTDSRKRGKPTGRFGTEASEAGKYLWSEEREKGGMKTRTGERRKVRLRSDGEWKKGRHRRTRCQKKSGEGYRRRTNPNETIKVKGGAGLKSYQKSIVNRRDKVQNYSIAKA